MPIRRSVFAAVLLAVVPAIAASPPAEERPLAGFRWLADLAGACWTGSDEAGRTTDRQCYATEYGRFLSGTIEIRAGSATGKPAFRGGGLFAWDAERERIVYYYWASAGHFGSAEAHFDGDRLVFPPTDEGEPGKPRIRSVWSRVDADTFRVVRERGADSGWAPHTTATYRRDRAAAGPPAESPLAALAFLGDSCFLGTFADGKTRDLVCYEWVFGGKFLRSRHRVIGGTGPYSGETLFAHDASAGRLVFAYYNSLGGVIRGDVLPTEDGLAFPSEKVAGKSGPAELRSAWRRSEGGGYVATTEKLEAGAWKPVMKIDFARIGPASLWTETD